MAKRCSKCNKEFSDEKGFCDTCGSELNGQKHHKISPLLLPWLVFAVILLVIGGLALPTKVVEYQVEVPYIETVKYNVEVPYEDVEEYVAKVPYETKEQYVESVPITVQKEYFDKVDTNVPLKYTTEWVKCTATWFGGNGESTIKFTNIDSEAGTFIVNIGYESSPGQFTGNAVSNYIPPASSAIFTYTPTPSSFAGCNYRIISIPTKIVSEYVKKYKDVTEYKDVIKEKTVTKYRDETRYRKVTKTRTETREKEVRKTRTETRQKEVNWLFGFDAILKFRNL